MECNVEISRDEKASYAVQTLRAAMKLNPFYAKSLASMAMCSARSLLVLSGTFLYSCWWEGTSRDASLHYQGKRKRRKARVRLVR